MREKTKIECTDYLQYRGKVDISILDGKKVISHKTLSNSGKWPLFLFLAQCLTGKYPMAETNRPKYIQLFKVNAEEDKLFDTETEWEAKSQPVLVSTSPTLYYNQSSSEASGPERAEGNFKFIIAFSQLFDKDINLLALKSVSNINKSNTVCAYILLDDASSLIPESLQHSDRYNIFIEWKLSILN